MRKRRYEILLPTTHNDGRLVDEELLENTFDEVADHLGGISVTPRAVLGIWVHEGKRHKEEMRLLSVDVDETPENQAFFVQFKVELLKRFEQIEIYIVSYPIDIL